LSLRSKIYLIVGATLLVAVAVVFMVSQTVFLRGFASVEHKETQDQIKRAQAAVTWDLLELGVAAKSYSSQDQVLASLRSKGSTSADSSLSGSFFTAARANAAAVLDQTGALVWGRGFDLVGSQPTPLPTELEPYFSPQGGLSERFRAGTEVSGILVLSGAPMLVDSRPITDTGAGGRVLGTIVIGRWLDAGVLAELGARTRLDLSLVPIDATDLPSQVRDATANGETTATTFVIPRNAETVAGYAVLQDVFGQPALVMRVETPRAVWAQGASSVRYFMLCLFALVVVFGVVLSQMLERSLFRRLAAMTAQVRHMRPGRAKLEPIAAGSNDELGLLAETINAGFLQLDETRTQREVQAKNLSSTLEELNGRHKISRSPTTVSSSSSR
jgi:sensor domain CHASE-containing protein